MGELKESSVDDGWNDLVVTSRQPKPWSVRTPAAIEKEKKILADTNTPLDWVVMESERHEQILISPGEAALAEAAHQWHPDPICADSGCLTGPALIAYTEKIESF